MQKIAHKLPSPVGEPAFYLHIIVSENHRAPTEDTEAGSEVGLSETVVLPFTQSYSIQAKIYKAELFSSCRT